jgi:hypothetical protein
MSEQTLENESHFPPEFILRAWAPDNGIRKAWVWDRMRWSENITRELPAEAQRGTVSLRSFDTTFVARGDAQENSRWGQVLESGAAPVLERLRRCEGSPGRAGPLVVPLDRVGGDSESVGHVVFSSVVRVHGHPPAYRSEAKARWYLRQLEAPISRRKLWERLGGSRRLHLVVQYSGSLALSDWATIPLLTELGEILLLPISPSHALLAAPRSTPAAHLQYLLSTLPLPDLSEAVYGVQICLWPRAEEDLLVPAQRAATAERVRANMLRWRQVLQLRASIHDEIDE